MEESVGESREGIVIQKATVILLVREGEILLARKLKKIGAGKWNGYGGKPEPGDATLEETAVREMKEEGGGDSRDVGA